MPTEPFLPYGRQSIDEDDIEAVVEVLRSDWLTTGPAVNLFEEAVASFVGTRHAVAVSSGTAALHAAVFAANIEPGDEVILPPLTFVATANAVLYLGGTPVFADIGNDDLLLDYKQVENQLTPRTKAIIAVDYAGQPCGYSELRQIAENRGMLLIADACHSLGATYNDQPSGGQADLTAFSFHPVKPATTAEGGVVVTDDSNLAEKMRSFRNHGITSDHRQRQQQGTWEYQMTELGYNYRLSDLQSALGCSQLKKLSEWIKKRQHLAELYRQRLTNIPEVKLLKQHKDRTNGWHLMVIRVAAQRRNELFQYLREQGIGANVHYGLVYHHPYYQQRFNFSAGHCPVAEQAETELLSLPIFPTMQETDVDRVCKTIVAFFTGPSGAN